ncbi:hypothetical protein yrohd0001_21200 [Yersinia rohdei ATCC 43380]|nr:hypothetical protein yrohd0001_21200 [Yersinia rohdei ATCC 43380]
MIFLVFNADKLTFLHSFCIFGSNKVKIYPSTVGVNFF